MGLAYQTSIKESISYDLLGPLCGAGNKSLASQVLFVLQLNNQDLFYFDKLHLHHDFLIVKHRVWAKLLSIRRRECDITGVQL